MAWIFFFTKPMTQEFDFKSEILCGVTYQSLITHSKQNQSRPPKL